MLKKFLTKLRNSIAPSPAAKPAHSAGSPAHSKPHSASRDTTHRDTGHPARAAHRDAIAREAGRGPRREGGRPAQTGHGPSEGQARPRQAAHEGEPRREGGGSRGGRGRGPRSGGERSHSQGAHAEPSAGARSHGPSSHGVRGPRRNAGRGGEHGGARQERPKIDQSYDHPRREAVKPAVPVDIPKMDTAFSKLGLSDPLAYAVQEMGYVDPTPIQAQAIPIVLSGRDVIGSAQTGTGKTAAFALPIIQRLGAHGDMRCLILEPTRELALQVEEAFQKFARFTDLRVTIVYGGVGYGKQTEDLRKGMDILAATPGRLLDHLEQRNCSLDKIGILVLDEVDRMLDMGFLPDVKRIVAKCPKDRQTLFFTATLPPEIEQLAAWALRDPAKVEIGRQRSPAETVAHAFYPVVANQKFELLQLLLEQTEFKSVIIFCRTRMGADRIASRLKTKGHTVGVLHSDRNQRERIEALEGFKAGRYEVLVATDIAARGLDIAGVSHVINYDVPENAEDYVHRIGRTGRAHNTGDAFTLVTEDDVRDARSIERYMGMAVERKKIEGFPYVYSALFDEKAVAETLTAAMGGRTSGSRLHRGMRR